MEGKELPGDPKECRQRARNCLQIAEEARSADVARTFVDLTHSWTKLAIELESAQALLAALDEEPTYSVETAKVTTTILRRF